MRTAYPRSVRQPDRDYAEQADWPDRGPDVVVPAEPVAVVITAVFEDGYAGDVEGVAKAWAPRAVSCFFPHLIRRSRAAATGCGCRRTGCGA